MVTARSLGLVYEVSLCTSDIVGKGSTSAAGAENRNGETTEFDQSLARGGGCGLRRKVVGATSCSSYAPRCIYCCCGRGYVEEPERADGKWPPLERHAKDEDLQVVSMIRRQRSTGHHLGKRASQEKIWLEFVPNLQQRIKSDRRPDRELSLGRHQVLNDARPQPTCG